MRLLFVVTGNKGRLSHVFANQLASLAPKLTDYRVFTVQGKGLKGYLLNLLPLRRMIKSYQPDLVHAHYSLCGYLTALTGFKPIVVSLMGSDCRGKLSVLIVRLFHKLAWSYSIVKSREMQVALNLKHRTKVVPNGVDLGKFPFIERREACTEVGFDPELKNIIFIANPQRPEKNYALATEAIKILGRKDVRFHTVYDTTHERINNYMRAADVLLMTSYYEGSPNVIKEAMACDLPIVSTDVGDVKANINGLNGCYITDYSAEDIAKALASSFDYKDMTGGRERIKQLGLDAFNVSETIVRLYQEVLSNAN